MEGWSDGRCRLYCDIHIKKSSKFLSAGYHAAGDIDGPRLEYVSEDVGFKDFPRIQKEWFNIN